MTVKLVFACQVNLVLLKIGFVNLCQANLFYYQKLSYFSAMSKNCKVQSGLITKSVKFF